MSEPQTEAEATLKIWSRRPVALALRYGPIALLLAAAVWVWSSGLVQQLNFNELSARHHQLEAYTAAHPWLTAAVYTGVFTLGVALCLPVALLLNLTGGYLFGTVIGGLLAAFAGTVGGGIIFLICRTAAGDGLKRMAGPRLAKLHTGAQRDALSLVLFLRLVPMMPFWLINVGAAVIGMPLRTFLLASAVGVAPSSFIYAALGAGLGKLFDSGEAPGLRMLMQPGVLIPLGALMALSAGPLGWRLLRARRAPPT